MIIIIEGVDKTGKSTIVQDLIDLKKRHHEDSVVLKLSQKPKNDSKEEQQKVKVIYQELFEQARRLSKEKLVIFDRAYPSEMIYSIKRKYDSMKDSFWWNFDSELGSSDLTKMKTLLIYCTAPVEVIKERMKKENEKFLKTDEVAIMQERYQTFLKKTHLPYLVVDTTKDRIANISTVRNLLRSFEKDEHLKT